MIGGQASGAPSSPIFFSNQEQYALSYANRKDYSGGVLLRVKRTPEMKINDVEDYGGYVEYYTNREIPVEEIEVKTNSGWVPMENYDLLSENRVSSNFLRQLSKNVNNKLAREFLVSWADKGVDNFTTLSDKEFFILNGIRRDGKVPSTKHLKENIKDIVRTDAAFNILDSSNCAGSDWGAGGCAILAQALNKLEGYPMVVIYNLDYEGPEHFGVITPTGSIIDHDGEHSNSKSWIKFFMENEFPRKGGLVVKYFTPDMNMNGIKFDSEAADKLAELIKKHKMIRETVRGILKENLQLADKTYFTPGKLSPKVRQVIIDKITGGDVWTKLISDIYYATLQDSHAVGDWAVRSIDDPNAEIDRTEKKIEDDVLNLEEWKKIKSYYQQLKSYNKNVFPIEGLNVNGVGDIWSLIQALKQRATILEKIKDLPSVALRNMRADIRTPRNGNQMNNYRDRLEYFLAHYSLLGNRSEELKKFVEKKMFKSGVDIEQLIDFAEEKENLLGGKKFDKDVIKDIISDNNHSELEIIYEKDNIMIVEVSGPYGIKDIGCNSLWCFTYGEGYSRNWSEYSYNDTVYVIIDFDEKTDSADFMNVVIKPLDYNPDDEEANDDRVFNMANENRYDALSYLNSVIGLDTAKKLLTFYVEPEEEEYEEDEEEKEYVDPNQMSLFEVRKLIREVIEEEVIEETQTGQKDLEKFSNDILKSLGERIVKEREHLEFLDPSSPELRYFPMFFTGTMTGEGYKEIGDFVNETSIKIYPTQALPKETQGSLGYASPEETRDGREIFQISLKYSDRDVEEINTLFKEQENVNASDVYFRLYYMFYSTLLHEMQHAYDAWRSKGKAFNGQMNRNFIKRKEDAKRTAMSKQADELTPEEMEAINNSYKEYQNLVHEINARYAQAMHSVRMTGVNFETFEKSMNPWEGVYSAFKGEFDGWRNLSDKMKRKLTRRLAKAYSETADAVSADNK